MNQKSTIAIAVALVGGVAISVANPWHPKPIALDPASSPIPDQNRKDLETRNSSLHLDASQIKHVKISAQLGEVNLSTNSSSAFDAQITKSVNRPVSEKEKQWLENPWLKARIEGDTLTVYEDKTLKPDLTTNSDKNNRQLDFKVNIQIPSGQNADVTVLAGKTKISGDYRNFESHVSAGEVSLVKFNASESLKIELDAGQVNATLNHVPTHDSAIRVSVGQVKLDVTGNATIDALTSVGSISYGGDTGGKHKGLGSKQHIQFGSGGPTLTVDVGAGNIKFGGDKAAKTEDKSDTNEEFDIELPDLDMKSELNKDSQLNEDIQREISRALDEARIEMNSVDIDKEVAKAMKDADKELNISLRELEIEMNQKDDFEVPFRNLGKDALVIARDALKDSMVAVKNALRHIKIRTHKVGTKKQTND
jgi:hypothetical protein